METIEREAAETLTLFCCQGGTTMSPAERVRWGWSSARDLEDGVEVTDSDVSEEGEATAEDVALEVERCGHLEAETLGERYRAASYRRACLVVWDEATANWWMTGVRKVARGA